MQDISKQRFDVIVVGSGASGGWAAKRLAEAGVKVALLDCGRPQSDKNFTEHMPPFELKYRDRVPEVIRRTRPIQKDCYACTEFNYQWFSNDIDEPYATAPGTQFSWQGRVRMVGGRTNVWGRVSLRLSDLDLKAASFDGFGADWPLAYKDLAPYYDLVEEYVGVAGRAEGYPYLPDGKFQPEMPLNCLEAHFRDRVKAKLGWVVGTHPYRQHHQTSERPRPMPLLRALPSRMRYPFLFQLRLYHGGRRARERELYADPERHGLQGADGSGSQSRSRHPLHRSQHSRGERG